MYISNFLGANAPLVTSSYVAGEAVQKGQVAVVGADGLAYYALDPSQPGANIRPIANTTVQYFPEIALSSTIGTTILTSAGNQATIMASAVLSNGDFVLGWQDATSGNVEFEIFGPLGAAVTGVTAVSAGQGTAGNQVQLVAIPTGGFFIVFGAIVASTSYVKFASYTNQGIAVIPPTTVDSAVTTGSYGMLGIDAALLSCGNPGTQHRRYVARRFLPLPTGCCRVLVGWRLRCRLPIVGAWVLFPTFQCRRRPARCGDAGI